MSNLLAISTDWQWLTDILDAVTSLINPILIVVAVAGIVYAIWVGIKFVRADDKTAREEAKNKLIMVIVGIVVTVLLIALFYFLALNIDDIVTDIRFDSDVSKRSTTPNPTTSPGVVSPVQQVVTVAKMLLAR